MSTPTKNKPAPVQATAAPAAPAETPTAEPAETQAPGPAAKVKAQPDETGGPKGPEPTRYGDWERNGRCVDF